MDRLRLSADAQSAGLANFKEAVQLRRSLSELDRGRAIVSAAIGADQAALFRRYNRRLAVTKLALAKRGSDPEAAQRWRRRLLATPAELERERRDLQTVLAAHTRPAVAVANATTQRSAGSPPSLLLVAERQADAGPRGSLLEQHRQRVAELRQADRVRRFCDSLRRLRVSEAPPPADYYAQLLATADGGGGGGRPRDRPEPADGADELDCGVDSDGFEWRRRLRQRPLTSVPKNLTFRSVTLPPGWTAGGGD